MMNCERVKIFTGLQWSNVQREANAWLEAMNGLDEPFVVRDIAHSVNLDEEGSSWLNVVIWYRGVDLVD